MKREARWVLALCVAGLAARLASALFFPTAVANDQRAYEELAQQLAAGHGFVHDGLPETVRPPLFPALLAVVYGIGGVSHRAARIVECLLDTGTCLLVWAWTRRRLGPRRALFALAISACSLSAIAVDRTLLSEGMAMLMVTASMVAFDLRRGAASPLRWAALCGLLLGITTLTRWNFSLLPLALVAVLATERSYRGVQRLAQGAMLFGVFALALAPWLVRNQRLLGAPVLSTQTGITLYMSHFRGPGQPYGMNTHDATTARADAMGPIEGNRFLVRETLRRLRERPAWAFQQYPRKLSLLLVPLDWEVIGNRVFNPPYLVMMLLALAGLLALAREDLRFEIAALAPLLYLCALAFPFYGSPRFRLPAEACVAPVAAAGLDVLLRSLRRKGKGKGEGERESGREKGRSARANSEQGAPGTLTRNRFG